MTYQHAPGEIPFTDEQYARMTHLYKVEKKNTHQISAVFGISASSVRNRLLKLGVTPRASGRPSSLPEGGEKEVAEEIARLRKLKMTWRQVAKRLNIHVSAAYRIGLPMERTKDVVVHLGLTQDQMRRKTGKFADFSGPMPLCSNGSFHVEVTPSKKLVTCEKCLEIIATNPGYIQ